MSALLEKIAAHATPTQGAPTPAPVAGVVSLWTSDDEARVRKGDTIAEVQDIFGDTLVAAAADGILHYVKRPGDAIAKGEALAYIAPAPQEPLKRSISIAPSPTTSRPPIAPPAPNSAATAPVAQEPAPPVERRSTLGDEVELMAVEELAISAPLPKPTKRPRRPRVVKRTCHPTSHQIEDFKALMEWLGKEGYGYSAGEMERIAFRLLLSLPKQELIKTAEENRDLEIAGGYGYGVGPRG